MKASKIAIYLIVAALLGTGFYLFQKNRQDKSLVAHNKKKFQQLTEVAQTSNSAGLLVMASTINKYHQTKGHYPKDLKLLYPEFIPDEAFISTPSWRYYPKDKTFLIEKSIKGSKKFSSMGPDMKLKTGKGKTGSTSERTVSRDRPKKYYASTSSKGKPDFKKDTQKDQVSAAFSLNKIKKQNKRKSNNKIKASKFEYKFTIVKKELNNSEKFLLTFEHSNLYIWKTNEGVIGFSDTQYPDIKNLTIYKDKNWIKYQENPNYSAPK